MTNTTQEFETLSETEFSDLLRALRAKRPLIHCLTNEVVQEITADVLLAAGASPAMVVALEEAGDFARMADGLLVNLGTPTPDRTDAMTSAVYSAQEAFRPWVLDPVAAGCLPWRDTLLARFLLLCPMAIRANASEVLALAKMAGLTKTGGHGKGVDSTASSEDALEAASLLARRFMTTVFVTGATDYVTNGRRTVAIPGGNAMATLVVGTGCSLSALTAAFLSVADDPVKGAAAASLLAKKAAEYAARHAKGPGSFRTAYIDGLYLAE